jgi:hypothetical protein
MDDEQRRIARKTYAPGGFRRRRGICCVGAPPSVKIDVPHRLRRAALHLPLRRSERGLLYFHHGLLASDRFYLEQPACGITLISEDHYMKSLWAQLR